MSVSICLLVINSTVVSAIAPTTIFLFSRLLSI